MVNQEQLPDKISELVDHLRSQSGVVASLTEVASVTEVLIATMQAYFRSIDTSIYRECRSLSDYISTARLEIAALSPKDLENSRIPRAGLELDAIVQQTEEATNTIMTSAENILTALGGDMEKNKEAVEAAVMQIFEACSFQDITGQRINKVVQTLSHIEQRIGDLRDVMGVTEEHMDAVAAEEDITAAHSTDSLATGPSLAGEGIDQSEVDALLEDDSAGTEEPPVESAEEAPAEEAGGSVADTTEPSEETAPDEDIAPADAKESEEAAAVEQNEKVSEISATPAASESESEGDSEGGDDSEDSDGRTTSQEEIDALFA